MPDYAACSDVLFHESGSSHDEHSDYFYKLHGCSSSIRSVLLRQTRYELSAGLAMYGAIGLFLLR